MPEFAGSSNRAGVTMSLVAASGKLGPYPIVVGHASVHDRGLKLNNSLRFGQSQKNSA